MTSLFEAQTKTDVINALKRGAKINEIIDETTPLYVACENGNWEVVDALLNNGANPLIRDGIKSGPIQNAAKNGYVDIVERLLQAGVNINDDTNGTPLYYASVKGNIDVINFLLSKGADIDFVSFDGTPLMGACRYGRQKSYRASAV